MMGELSAIEVRARVLAWYDANRRDLPWRRTADPYRILVAEYLLQRTRIVSGTPYYERFVARFPSIQDLAAASLDDVLAVWEGLGFYRRARNLHAAARAIVERHGGQLPESFEELAALPGMGPYTAGAVASIAFGIPVPAVDGNVTRVIARLRRALAVRSNACVSLISRERRTGSPSHEEREPPPSSRSCSGSSQRTVASCWCAARAGSSLEASGRCPAESGPAKTNGRPSPMRFAARPALKSISGRGGAA